jgi:plastocyanin
MNKTAAMVLTAAVLVSGLIVVSALGRSVYAQSDKEVKIDIVKGAASLNDKAFSPSPAKVQEGAKVTWTNVDTAVHTVTSGKGPGDSESGKMFDSKVLAPNKTFSFTFAKEGAFDYYCALHPSMVGRVVVDKAETSGTSDSSSTITTTMTVTQPAAGPTKVVEIVKGAANLKSKAFLPSSAKVKVGTTVTWKNEDTAVHTVHSGTPVKPTKTFDSKVIGPNKEFSFKFDKKGTYRYYCELHPTMVGKVIVK